MRRLQLGIALGMALTALAQVGCAAVPPVPPIGAMSTDALARAVAADPTDLDAAELLIAGHLLEGRVDDALRLASALHARFPGQAGPTLLLALTHEQRFDTLEARTLYREYLDAGGPVDDEAGGRLERIERDALRLDIRAMVSGAAQRPALDPARVAILPPVPSGDSVAVPLAMATARVLAEHLSLTDRLSAVEHARVAAALAEVAPDPARWSDPAVGEAVGRLLGTGLVVQGALAVAGDQITIESALLTLGAGGGANAVQILPRTAPLIGFYEALLPTAVTLYQLAGRELTDEELAALTELGEVERPTGDATELGVFVAPRGLTLVADAWLAVGRGLIAETGGSYAEAAGNFDEAVRIDPYFALAAEHARRVRALAASASPPGELAWRAAHLDSQVRAVQALRLGPTHTEAVGTAGTRTRAPLAEVLGQELGTGATIELIFDLSGVAP